MHIIAHRGASGYEPENTLRAIRKALVLDADMIEIDVRVLPSGEIILLHDERLERATNGHGSVYEIDFATLRALDAGKGEVAPTLHEAIECVQRKVPLNIELKDRGSGIAVASALRKYLTKGWRPEDFLISSFNHHEISAFKQSLPQVPASALIYSIPLDYAACCKTLGAQVISPAADLVTPEFVADAHARGLQFFAWIWEPITDKHIRELYSMGVDGVFSDYPDITRRTIRASGSKSKSKSTSTSTSHGFPTLAQSL